MKLVDYNYPIFVYSVGVSGLSKGMSEEKLKAAKAIYENMNVNMWFVSNVASGIDDIKCIWQCPTSANIKEYEF